MENEEQIKEKLQKGFKGFLNPSYTLYNDVYLEMLITHLSGKGEKDYSGLLTEPFVIDWIEEYLGYLQEAEPGKMNPRVTSFMRKLFAQLIRNAWLLTAIKDRQLVDKLNTVVQKHKESFSPTVKLGHEHFLAATEAWRIIVDYCQKNRTIYVYIIYDIVYRFTNKINEEQLRIEILGEITRPITENVLDQNSNTVLVDDTELQRKLSPTINLLCFILQKTIESESKTKIAYYPDNNVKLEINLRKLTDMTQNHQFLGKILKLCTHLNYAKLVYEKSHSNSIPSHDFNQFGVNFFNLMKFLIVRRSSANVLMVAELNHILWKKLGSRAPEEIQIENKRVVFENQLITFQILPLLFVYKNQHKGKSELLDNYVMKLLTINCEHTLRVGYAFREYPRLR